MPTINWYPGHIAKAERKLKELSNLVDVTVVLIDSRIPYSSYYDGITNLIGETPQLLLLNKTDLADPVMTNLWKESFESLNQTVLMTTSTSNKDLNVIIKTCYELGKPRIEKLIAQGRLPRAIRVMVMGMPNVGKSSLINQLAKIAKVKVGPKAGVTKSIQWVRINPKVELLDTPGVIPMKLDDQRRAANLAIVDSIGEHSYNPEEIANELISIIWKYYPDKLAEYYNLENNNQPTLNDIALSRNLISKGNSPDILRAAQRILSDFRSGKIGRITLENSPRFKVTTSNSFR